MLTSAAVYDPKTEEWEPLPDMAERRTQPMAMAVGKRIYVCGGYGGTSSKEVPLDSVEKFDPELGEWQVAPPMSAKRYNAACACMGPLLFIFGGSTDSSMPLKTTERFDAREGKCTWESMTSMKEQRQGAAACIFNGFPYVCGGHDGVTCLASVEKLTPLGRAWLDGGKEGTWQTAPSMSMPRYGLMCCLGCHTDRRPKVFCFGGHNGMERTGTLEVLDAEAADWEVVPKNWKADGKRMDARAGAAMGFIQAPASTTNPLL